MQLSSLRFTLKIILKAVLVLLLACSVFWLCVYAGLFGTIPSKEELKAKQNNTASEVYTADSVLIARYFIQDRTNISYNDISKDVIDGLIATEDVRFYKHRGVDIHSLFRVFFKTILNGDESAGGGSTISQQLAKNLYPRRHYRYFSTAINKIREMIIARRIETVYNKQEILELYLNTVPMGSNIYGIERAARVFFNKSAKTLRTEEAAVLIGMLKANTSYNPLLHPDLSRLRRNVVLEQMTKYGFIKPVIADSLKKLPLKTNFNRESAEDLAPYFTDRLRIELEKWCKTQQKDDGEPYDLYTDGLRIYTTIDSRVQKLAEKAVRNQMSRLQALFDQHWKNKSPWGNNTSLLETAVRNSKRYAELKEAGKTEDEIRVIFRKPVNVTLFAWGGTIKRKISPLDSVKYYQKLLNAGLLSVEPGTGYVKAWVGGINHSIFKYDHVLGKRQAGSTFKPIVYAAALEKGINPCRYFENRRIVYPEYENWSPQNSDGQYGGKYTMKGALARSINTVSAQILMRTGIKNVITLAHKMGIDSDIPEVPSIALGTANLSLFEMVAAYSTFLNSGKAIQPIYITSITDRKGHILLQHMRSPAQQVISADNAAIMLEMMKGVVDEGSASSLRVNYKFGMDIGGKTGTTQNQADGWFIGFTPDLLTGVWVGAENPAIHFRTLDTGQGARTALPLWANFMQRLIDDRAFEGYRYSRFDALPPELRSRFDCPSFVADKTEQADTLKKESFFKRILKKGLNLFRKKKKNVTD